MLRKFLAQLFSRGQPPEQAGPEAPGGLLASQKSYVAYLGPFDRPTWLTPDSALSSPMASTRLRILAPGKVLARRIPVLLLPYSAVMDASFWRRSPPRALIIGKLSTGSMLDKPELARAIIDWLPVHAASFPVFADINDNLDYAGRWLQLPIASEYQRALLRHCRVVTSCAALAEQLRPVAKHGISIVEDPVEAPAAAPVSFNQEPVFRLCWFGVFKSSGWLLEQALRSLAPVLATRPAAMTIVAHPSEEALVRDLAAAISAFWRDLAVTFVAWSPESVAAALAACDAVLLPQETGSPWGQAKSHNRLVTAIQSGRFALASPIGAYRELSEFAWVNEDFAAGLRWALENPEAVRRNLLAGQGLIRRRFSQQAVADKWASVLGV